MIARKAMPVPILAPACSTAACRGWLKLLFLVWGLSLSSGVFSQPAIGEASTNQTPADPAIEAATPIEPELETAPETAEAPLYKSRSERDNQLLAKAAVDEVRWLGAADEPILALFRPTATRANKGVLLLLHAAETPSQWPPALENARRTLPQHGWVTLALTLPSRLPPLPPKREFAPAPTAGLSGNGESSGIEEQTDEPGAATETAEQSANAAQANEPVDARETALPDIESAAGPQPTRAEMIAQHLEAALAWLAQEQYSPILLLVDNSSAIDSLAFLKAKTESPIAAIALVNLQAQEELSQAELNAVFTADSPPILDVFLAPEQGQMTAMRKDHRAAALRNKVPVYQQLHLPPQQPTTLDDEKNFWVERLRGFMDRQVRIANGD